MQGNSPGAILCLALNRFISRDCNPHRDILVLSENYSDF